MPGTAISDSVGLSSVSPDGLRLWLGDEELYLPFADFPWFRDATIRELPNIERPAPSHLYWPDIDVDLSVESIRHPERFPLEAKIAR